MISKQMAYSTILASLLVTLPLVSASSYLRATQTANLTVSKECTLLVVACTRELGDTELDDEDIFECEMDADDEGGVPGLSLPLDVSEAQKKALKEKLESGELVSAESTLIYGQVPFDVNGVHLPPELEISLGTNNRRKSRNLATTTGTKPVLVVKVTDSAGKAPPESAATISDDVFGTLGDPLNLKSQMNACSFGQLDIVPGSLDPEHEAAPGVVEVTIPITLEGNSRTTIRDAITIAVNNKLGINLPGPYQSVMYLLEGCYQQCGWAAYATVNSWNTVYQGRFYKHAAVQMHEVGHNLNLAHSGGLDGKTYTDHTGLMGNPYYEDDEGAMCFNAAKSWQLGWYDSNKLVVDPSFSHGTYTLVGTADFDNNPAGHPVVIKLETGTSRDQFIAFNRATGVNRESKEGGDEVTIVEAGQNGEGYSQSFLKGHLVTGETYTYSSWAGSVANTLTITVDEINLSANPATATITICVNGDCGCEFNADCDDGLFCNGVETCNGGVCQVGTPPSCDDGLYCNGVETCNEATNSCQAGTPPVYDGDCREDVQLVGTVGYTEFPHVPVQIVEQTTDSVTFQVTNTFAEAATIYTQFDQNLGDVECMKEVNVEPSDPVLTYTAACTHFSKIAVVHIYFTDASFLDVAEDNAEIPRCCKGEENPTVEYAFKLYCEPRVQASL